MMSAPWLLVTCASYEIEGQGRVVRSLFKASGALFIRQGIEDVFQKFSHVPSFSRAVAQEIYYCPQSLDSSSPRMHLAITVPNFPTY